MTTPVARDSMFLKRQFDAEIMQNLLQKYKIEQKKADFIKTAEKAINHFEGRFDKYILDNITPKDNLPLYLKVLENHCYAHQYLEDYKILQQYWSLEKREKFINRFVRNMGKVQFTEHSVFVAQLYFLESRHADILKLLNTQDWIFTKNFDKILELSARHSPNETMDKVMEHAENYLSTGQRGRDLYSKISLWLKTLKQFNNLEKQVKLFAEGLASTYSRLGTMKEELRNAQLLSKNR